MVNWYYVQGSERVGPVSEETLRDLFQKEVLNLESYIWKKGFANWEKLKDVSELDFKNGPSSIAIRSELKNESEVSSPEIVFNFDWDSIGEKEELFFIKIGQDRKQAPESVLYGPYSLEELKEALEEKRINMHTYLFSPGMPGWIEIGQTPLDPKNLRINTANILDEVPLLMVLENNPLPLIAMVQKAGSDRCTLIGEGHFQKGKEVLGSIYSGTTLKAKNLKLMIEEYSPIEQKALCSISKIDEAGKKIMQNYAN